MYLSIYTYAIYLYNIRMGMTYTLILWRNNYLSMENNGNIKAHLTTQLKNNRFIAHSKKECNAYPIATNYKL